MPIQKSDGCNSLHARMGCAEIVVISRYSSSQAPRGSPDMISQTPAHAPIVIHAAVERGRRGGGPANWAEDLSPVPVADWGFDLASQLLERAGFGGTPEDIARLAEMGPERAVAALLDYHTIPNDHLAPFERSDV